MTLQDVDKIYFLHLSDRYDREQWMNNQIQQIGFPKDKVNIWWTCRRNISNEVTKYIESLHSDFYELYKDENPGIGGGIFNCVFEHYSIIRTSYERGFNYILIFEDDVKFMVDLPVFEKFIELLPNDFHICKFHYNLWDGDILLQESSNHQEIPTLNTKIKNPYYIYNDCGNLKYKSWSFSTGAYILDRQGMKDMIEYYNKDFCVADWIFAKIQNSTVYHCNYQLVSTQDWNCQWYEYLPSDLWKINTNQKFSQFQ